MEKQTPKEKEAQGQTIAPDSPRQDIPQTNSQYSFSSVSNTPNSLVMLKVISNVLPLLVIQPVFIILNILGVEQRMKDEGIEAFYFDDIETMKSQIESSMKRQHIELLAPIGMAKVIGAELGEVKEIKKIHFYIKPNDNCALGPLQKHVIDRQGYFNVEETIESWKKTKSSSKITKNRLPNIIHLNKDGWKASIQLRTMIAMLNQTNTNEREIMTKFYELDQEVYGGSGRKYQPFNDIGQTIYKYTEPGNAENFLTNNLLRASKNPAEIYYCQPYFRRLFESIKKLYLQQCETMAFPVICYRGASASQKEIENYAKNEGQIIQNLGFFSTSLDQKIGEKFATNLMFVIEIKQQERDPQLDYGYANIAEYSRFPDEQQILFNPLNTFRIEKMEKRIIKSQSDVQDDRQVDTVYLTYGPFARIRYQRKNDQKLENKLQKYVGQVEYLVKDINENIFNQGDAFLSKFDYLNGGISYWQEEMNHGCDQLNKAVILNKIGQANWFKGKYQQALKTHQQSLIILEERGKKDYEYVKTLYYIGKSYRSMGRYQDSLKSFQDCIIIREQFLGKDHIGDADLLNNIGIIYYHMGKNSESLKKYEECLIIRGKGHPQYAQTLNNIGIVYLSLGRYEESLKTFEQCLIIKQSTVGKSHPQYAQTLNNIGNVQCLMGKYEESLKKYEQCLIIRQSTVGKSHPEYGYTLNNIGTVQCLMGKYKNSLKKYEQCLIIRQSTVGKNHPEYAQILANIGQNYYLMGRYEESLKNFEKSLMVIEQTLGKYHLIYGMIISNVGNVYEKTSRYKEALKNFEQSLIIIQEALGKNHQNYGIIMNRIGSTHEKMGKYEEALQNHQKSLMIIESAVGKNHFEYVKAYSSIGVVEMDMANYQKSLNIHKQCLIMREQIFGKNHPDYADSLNNMGNVFLKMGKYGEALKNYQECLCIREQFLGQDHPDYLTTLMSIDLVKSKLNEEENTRKSE